MRPNRSAQLSSSATRPPAARTAWASAARSVRPATSIVAGRSMPAKRRKASATLRRSGRASGSTLRPRNAKTSTPPAAGRHAQDLRAILHERLVGRVGAIPFEHGELGMVQGPALAVAEHVGEGEQPRLAGGQELLAGELGRGVQIEAAAGRPVDRGELGREGVQMRLVAGRGLQDRGVDLDEAARIEPTPQRRLDPRAAQQEGAPVGMDVGAPPGRWQCSCRRTGSAHVWTS